MACEPIHVFSVNVFSIDNVKFDFISISFNNSNLCDQQGSARTAEYPYFTANSVWGGIAMADQAQRVGVSLLQGPPRQDRISPKWCSTGVTLPLVRVLRANAAITIYITHKDAVGSGMAHDEVVIQRHGQPQTLDAPSVNEPILDSGP